MKPTWTLYLPALVLGCSVLGTMLIASTQTTEQPQFSVPLVEDDRKELPRNEEMARLAKDDPIAFIENCLKRYQREVKGYTVTLHKRERLKGKEYPMEVIDVCFNEDPHSVLMRWNKGARLAESVIYVAGQNNNKILVRPNGALARKLAGDVVERDVAGTEAKNTGRYTIDEFGIKKGTERTLRTWKQARERGDCEEEYLGVQKIKELGDRECFVLRRVCKEPEGDEKLVDFTFYFDLDTWLQTASILKDKDGKLVAEYYFCDVKLNPDFPKDQFDRSSLPGK